MYGIKLHKTLISTYLQFREMTLTNGLYPTLKVPMVSVKCLVLSVSIYSHE